MALNYADIKKSYKELQRICPNWREMDESQLRQLLESFGLKTFSVKDLDEARSLLQNGKPVIVLVNRDTYAKGDNHWIVLRGVKGKVFAVSDPADKEIRRLEARTITTAMERSDCKILFSFKKD